MKADPSDFMDVCTNKLSEKYSDRPEVLIKKEDASNLSFEN